MRERWGTFSVRDHVSDAPFVSDVLLYDRLIIPVPDPSDPKSGELWSNEGWKPELLKDCLDILGVKTDSKDGLALVVPWDVAKRQRFKSRMSVAAALATQQRSPEQGYFVDPFEMTRELMKEEFRPALPRGVSKAWTVAAYRSADALREDIPTDRRRQLAQLMSHRFLTPTGPDPDHEVLKRAVDLATTGDYRRKRSRFYEWQEEIIQENITDEKAIEELERLLVEYNEATRKAFRTVLERYVYTVIPIGLALTGTLLTGAEQGLMLAAAGSLVQVARFWRFDRKPNIAAGDLDAAAMVHDARKELDLA